MTVSLYAVEYSVKEDSYKMRLFDTMIEENNKATQEGRSDDYKLIGIAMDKKLARTLADKHALTLPEKLLNL